MERDGMTMRDESIRSNGLGEPPYALSGFESELISKLGQLVAELPNGAARLRISRAPGHPEWAEPYFAVVPTNPRAAPFKGILVARDLNLTIGVASFREFAGFARGGTIVKGASWQEEFLWIWQAVVSGGFTEKLYRNSKGKVIGWATKLSVNGRGVVIRNGRRSEGLFRSEKIEQIKYEPYFMSMSIVR
jgi:hypothetical protein